MQNRLYRRAGSLLYWYSYADERGFPVEHCTGTANLAAAQSIAAELGFPTTSPTHRAENEEKTGPPTIAEALAQFLS